jgi:cytochrome c-type biogenesis protein CcmH
VRGATFLLWFGPAVLMVGGLAVLVLVLRRRSRLGNEHFDPDEPEVTEEPDQPPGHEAGSTSVRTAR